VAIINIDVSGYSPDHVQALRHSPDWRKLCDLAAPLAEELTAIDNFAFDPTAYRKLDVPTTLIAGQLSTQRAPYGPSIDLFKQALDLDDVIVLPEQDHLAHVTAPEQLAHAIESGLGR
jgi:pimeloyl-ACP methyl ester carboxylesterase